MHSAPAYDPARRATRAAISPRLTPDQVPEPGATGSRDAVGAQGFAVAVASHATRENKAPRETGAPRALGRAEAYTLQPSGAMLPNRKSSPAPRRSHAIAVEVRVPGLGIAFGALASSVRPEGVFLSTFQELAIGTAITAMLSLPDGPAIIDGVVVDRGDPAGQGLAVIFHEVDDDLRSRLDAASSIAPPAARVA